MTTIYPPHVPLQNTHTHISRLYGSHGGVAATVHVSSAAGTNRADFEMVCAYFVAVGPFSDALVRRPVNAQGHHSRTTATILIVFRVFFEFEFIVSAKATGHANNK